MAEHSCQSPNILMPSTPLQLSGFLTGDTIQVKGDTGNLKFSVQFSVQEKQTPDQNYSSLNSRDSNVRYPKDNFYENSSVSLYMTPNDVQQAEDHQSACTTEPLKITNEVDGPGIVTRLRSGVITPVKYFPRISLCSIRPCRIERSRKKNEGKVDLFERVLRRHSSPVRPCSSYAFFVMATWGVVKSSSFGETSKQIGRMWYQLPQQEKKLYEKMAMKDNARYKKQRRQLVEKALKQLRKGCRSG